VAKKKISGRISNTFPGQVQSAKNEDLRLIGAAALTVQYWFPDETVRL
jgi:hypothetical protein